MTIDHLSNLHVVARLTDGGMLKGTTRDFSPNKPDFHVYPGGDLRASAVKVSLARLKAVFFVKTLDDGGGGQLASTIFLGTGRSDAALKVDMTDPAARALVEERDAIEQRIAALKLMKPSMDEAAYDAQMEKLLTDLALKTKALRDLQTKKDKP